MSGKEKKEEEKERKEVATSKLENTEYKSRGRW
jgi:hypothetical protein